MKKEIEDQGGVIVETDDDSIILNEEIEDWLKPKDKNEPDEEGD